LKIAQLLHVLESSALGKLFVPKREDLIGERSKLHYEKLHDCILHRTLTGFCNKEEGDEQGLRYVWVRTEMHTRLVS